MRQGGHGPVAGAVINLADVAPDRGNGREHDHEAQAVLPGGAVQVPGAQEFHLHHLGKIGGGHKLHKGVPDNAGPVDDPGDAAVVRNHPAQDRSHVFRIIDITGVISRLYPLAGQFLEGLGNFPTGSQPHGGIGLSGRGSGAVPARVARARACKTGAGGDQAVVVHLGVKFAAAQEDQARFEYGARA